MKTYYVATGTKTINGVIVESKLVANNVSFAVAMNTAAVERNNLEPSYGKFVQVTPDEEWSLPMLVGNERLVKFITFAKLH